MASWSIPLEKFAAATNQTIEKAAQRATFEVFKAVILRSPVDTGMFRGNWFLGINRPNTATAKASDSAGSKAIAEASKALDIKMGGVVYFTNSLPYAKRLEYGWSKQAPTGMVRLTVLEFKSHVDAAVRKSR